MEKTLRDLVARAKTEEAIRLLLQHTATDNDFNNRAIQLSARFQTYKRNLLGNLRDDSVLGVELANINQSLLAMVEEWALEHSFTALQTDRLNVAVKTGHNTAPTQSFKEGDFIRLYAQVTQPCFVRALYKLADEQVVLLVEGMQVPEQDVSEWIELGHGFEVSAPFGNEELHVFAQSLPFDNLDTIEKDGYRFVPTGLPAALNATKRGLKPAVAHAETMLHIITNPR